MIAAVVRLTMTGRRILSFTSQPVSNRRTPGISIGLRPFSPIAHLNKHSSGGRDDRCCSVTGVVHGFLALFECFDSLSQAMNGAPYIVVPVGFSLVGVAE